MQIGIPLQVNQCDQANRHGPNHDVSINTQQIGIIKESCDRLTFFRAEDRYPRVFPVSKQQQIFPSTQGNNSESNLSAHLTYFLNQMNTMDDMN